MKCKLCNQQTYGSSEYCYYHRKVKQGLMEDSGERAHNEKVDAPPAIKRFIKDKAHALARQFNVPVSDLKQEGYLGYWKANIDSTKSDSEIFGYLYITIEGKMKMWIAHHSGTIKVHERKFYDPEERVEYIDIGENETLTKSPEEIYIAREQYEILQQYLKYFRRLLKSNEKFIWRTIVMSPKPKTLRWVARKIKLSRQGVLDTKNRLIYWFKNFISDAALLSFLDTTKLYAYVPDIYDGVQVVNLDKQPERIIDYCTIEWIKAHGRRNRFITQMSIDNQSDERRGRNV